MGLLRCSALVLLALAACEPESSSPTTISPPAAAARERPRHILLLSMDTLRADRVGAYGHDRPTTPAIDELARRGALFENAQAPRGATWPTLTSLLTGKHPITHGVRSNGVRPEPDEVMLMHHLRAAGYATGAFLSNYDQAMPLPDKRGLDHLVAGFAAGKPQHQWDRRVTNAALKWLRNHADQPTFTWLHLMNPHRPYVPPPGTDALVAPYEGWVRDGVPLQRIRNGAEAGRIDIDEARLDAFLDSHYPRTRGTYREIARNQDDQLSMDQALDLITLADIELRPADIRYIDSRYDAEVRGSDNLMAEVLQALDELGLADDTLIVFTADHGEEMYDHNRYFFHGASIYQGTTQVPLVVHWPGHVDAARFDHLVEVSDVLPTVLELLDLAIPDEIEGQSFASLLLRAEAPPPKLAVTELHQTVEVKQKPPLDALYAIRDERWKLILNRAGLQPRTPPYTSVPDLGFSMEGEELYDLARDPRERLDLLATPELAEGDDDLDRAEYLADAQAARTRLTAGFDAWLVQRRPNLRDADEEISEDLREQLAGLGYVDGEAAPVVMVDPAPATRLLDRIRQLTDDGAQTGDPRALLLRAAVHNWDGRRADAMALLDQAMASAGAARPTLEQRAEQLGLR